ncbi:YslB family protein [Metabacillus arenae]|uniref:YslB family protein n=1 Tax=Metabacillus arenae TaxID=2771434 RepID=A0A926RWT7_9BACI|nr:YslB family protein [Metabacillus arenae]MBD1381153.1 YslB family protein [Metabacillus arenae]
MNKNLFRSEFEKLQDIEVPAFGFELMREVLIPDILGKESSQMLYWAGKNLARKYPLNSLEEVISFFHCAGWGKLSIVHKKGTEMEFELEGELIQARFKAKKEPFFQLEAGFLAQQMEQLNNQITETYEQIKRRANKAVFTVKWDHKDLTNM